MDKPNKSQLSYVTRFEKHVDIKNNLIFDKEFERDVIALRANENMCQSHCDDNDVEILPPLRLFLVKYDFPRAMEAFVLHYILSNKVDITRLDSDVYLVDEKMMTATGSDTPYENYKRYVMDTEFSRPIEIKLVLSSNTNLTQLREYISKNWNFIKDKQEGKSARVRQHYNAKRDRRIEELSKIYRPKDLPFELLKEGYNVASTDVSTILNKLKSKRKN